VVLIPDLYYRELPDNKFGYDQVEQAMALEFRQANGKRLTSRANLCKVILIGKS
jgi:dienelactone hydrolase